VTDVSIVIPAWNEAADLPGCLEAIAAQEGIRGALEVVLADGGSDDDTTAVAKTYAGRLGLELTVVDNPVRRTSAGLNRALECARGSVVVRIDARSRIPTEYVSTCVQILASRPEVGVVGGAQVAMPRGEGIVEQAIARALLNKWATGLSRYRRSAASGPADTVWMGAFRTDELRELGGWNERVALNEDFELNTRYREVGMTVWFEASLRSGYLPRPSLRALGRQYFYFGRVKGMWWGRGDRPSARQAALLLLPPTTMLALAALARAKGLPAAAATAAAAPVILEALGGAGSASGSVHLVSSVAIAELTSSWWVGVLVGFVGERIGMTHQHA
jgi:glycosyltransferase involved in cell wall biosynthesis